MRRQKVLIRVAVVVGAVGLVVLGERVRRARADGVPALNPLVYSGTLEEGGAPVNATRDFVLTVWNDPISTASANSMCVTTATGTAVVAGRFRVALDASCTAAVHSTPDLWIEVNVGGTSLGRTKLAAVPYALESARADGLTAAAANALVPPGTIVAFGGTTAPQGWLVCDGSAVSRTTYAGLFAAIGTAHGNGDGSTTFNVPDYRGRFLRGVDNGALRDPDSAARTAANPGGNAGDAVGSVQSGATALPSTPFTTTTAGDHAHTYGVYGATFSNGAGAASLYQGFPLVENRATSTAGAHSHGVIGGDNETRPQNAGVVYIIKD